jgi:hypothetical protein
MTNCDSESESQIKVFKMEAFRHIDKRLRLVKEKVEPELQRELDYTLGILSALAAQEVKRTGPFVTEVQQQRINEFQEWILANWDALQTVRGSTPLGEQFQKWSETFDALEMKDLAKKVLNIYQFGDKRLENWKAVNEIITTRLGLRPLQIPL